MIKVPQHPKYKGKNNGDHEVCFLCEKPIKSATYKRLHIHGGGNLVVTTEEAEILNAQGLESGDLWGKAVGPECLRQHPELKQYAY